MDKHSLAFLYPGKAMEKLIGCGPAQDQGCCFCDVDACGHAGQILGPERAIGGVRADDCHVGYAVARLEPSHTFAQLIDLADDIIAQHERRLQSYRLEIEMTPDHDIGVHDARGEHAHPHLARSGRWHGGLDHLESIGTAEAPDLNNAVVRIGHASNSMQRTIQRAPIELPRQLLDGGFTAVDAPEKITLTQ